MSSRFAGEEDRVRLTRSDPGVGIWLAELTYTNAKIAADNFPLGVGKVGAFTEHTLELERPIRIFKYPETLARALAEEGIPEIVGLSNFVWNSRLSLAFARRIKAVAPETIVVFGGPHYPLDAGEQEAFLRAHPEIDFYVPKEGELPFANLTATLINAGLEKDAVQDTLRSVHSIGADGRAFLTEHLPRLRDFTEVPSPYTMGKMDEFFDGELLPSIQTNRGCPFKCAFCDEGVGFYNNVSRHSQDQIDEELEYIARKMKPVRERGGRNDLRIADSNFGMYKQDLDTCRTIARCQEEYGWPTDIHADTGKNKRERVLKASEIVNHALRLTGSVQSLTPVVMENIQRSNISSGELMQLALQAADKDVSSRCELILALPGETRESHFQNIAYTVDAGFNHVVTYQLGILPGSEMFLPENITKFAMKSRYRIMADCIGEHEVLGERFISAELEEICMQTGTMSFDDYVACRKMHLLISIFYNNFSLQTNARTSQPLFASVLKFLRSQSISVSRWIQLLFEAPLEGKLALAFEHYEKATREELQAEPDEIERFVQQPQVVDQYLSGELGYNLLHTFRIVIQTKFTAELMAIADSTVRELLREVGRDSPENLAFISDAIKFDASRIANISSDIESIPTIALRYDIPAFLDDPHPLAVSEYALDRRKVVRFVLNEDQRAALERSIQLNASEELSGLGNTIVSNHIGRTASRMLLRTPVV